MVDGLCANRAKCSVPSYLAVSTGARIRAVDRFSGYGRALRALRRSRNLSQVELARVAKVSLRNLGRIELDVQLFADPKRAAAAAAVLEVMKHSTNFTLGNLASELRENFKRSVDAVLTAIDGDAKPPA